MYPNNENNNFDKFEQENDFCGRLPFLNCRGPSGRHSRNKSHGHTPFWFPFGMKFRIPRGPPLALSRESFKDLKLFTILVILADKEEGITGYELQEKYSIPRTNVLRILEYLEEKGYVVAHQKLVEGRAQKRFIITEKGKAFLEELKEKWAVTFAQMSDLAPPEEHGHQPFGFRHFNRFMRNISEIETKEDALDYFSGYRSFVKRRLQRLNRYSSRLEENKNLIDEIIDEVSQWDDFNQKKFKEFIEEKYKEKKEEDKEN